MKFVVLGAVTAALALSSVPATAQDNDPLACGRTSDGASIRLGAEVRDAEDKRIGSVSLTQCGDIAQEGKLRVFLDQSLGGDVKVFDLTGATTTKNVVRLPVTSEAIAQAPEAPDV